MQRRDPHLERIGMFFTKTARRQPFTPYFKQNRAQVLIAQEAPQAMATPPNDYASNQSGNR